MYYDSNIGKASYEAPEGICSGNLLVKRQFEIEDSRLIKYQDVDTVSNDEILKPYLGSNVDNRLKNIISTIQFEQNDIIRENISKNIIIQGVAGSGKTTVALHRIAYLVYNNREKIKPEQYMVIGPNKFFVDYISNVLPDLDVNNVNQLTYIELCSNFINENIQLINEEKKLILSISNPEKVQYSKEKMSMRYKEALDKFIKEIDDNIISRNGIDIKGYTIIDANIIKTLYNSIENNIIYDSINKKIEKTKLLLKKYIEDNRDKILNSINLEYRKRIKNSSVQSKYDEIKKIEYIEKELNKCCNTNIKKYFSNKIPKITDLYYEFLKNIEDYLIAPKEILSELKENIKYIKENSVEFEDLSALIYLGCKIIGVDNYKKYKQIAIDEAQDYGDFCFYVLKKMLPEASFSIFGDLAQSIYQYRGIRDWNDVVKSTFENNCQVKLLVKSYRTTTEIMNSANNITKFINLTSAEPVIRHGINVNYVEYQDLTEQINYIINTIKEYKSKGYKSIAVICKDNNEINKISLYIKNKIDIINVINSETKYDGGICIITSYLAKGLEFDAVIISNANEVSYSSKRAIDMKLLYVCMTRALHELKILYNGNIVEPLKKELL